jgi:hypothetical protein
VRLVGAVVLVVVLGAPEGQSLLSLPVAAVVLCLVHYH